MKLLVGLLFSVSLFGQFFPFPGPGRYNGGGGGGGGHTFTFAQTCYNYNNLGGTTTLSCTLSAPPTTGDVVVVGFLWYNSVSTPPSPTPTVVDGASNAYTQSPNSPGGINGFVYGFYWIANSSASSTITATFPALGSGASEMIVNTFHVSGGVGLATFDNDASAATTTAGPTVNTPTVPATAGDLLWFYVSPDNAITTINSPWSTGFTGGADGGGSGYILSATGNTAVNATQSPNGGWASVGMSFK